MSLRLLRFLALAAVGAFVSTAVADQLNAFPSLSLADGRSTTTITAQILDSSGHPVPDGTRVVFSTTLGSFRESVAVTTGGIARGILVSGSTAGIAEVTATPLAGGAGPTTMKFEFVADRQLLSTAREYIEIVAPGMMVYTVDTKIIGASGSGTVPNASPETAKSVHVRYRDIEIDADDIQLNIPTYEFRARRANLKVGKFTKYFDELYLRLNLRSGFGTTTFRARPPQFLATQGRWIGFAREKDDGSFDFSVPAEQDRYGLVEIKGPSITPAKSVAPAQYFRFEELLGSPSRISAKKAVVFPNKQIQFQKADIYVADNRVMRLPLFQVNLLQSSSPVITEDLLNVNDNQVAINYPYFLSLRPGESSLLRFRTGDLYGRSESTSSGAYLDYELNWNRGDDMDGGIAVRGIGRNDWRIDMQQYLKLDDRSTASAQIGIPANTSIFGSANVSRQFNGFTSSLGGNASQSLRGISTSTQDLNFSTETNPKRIEHTPFNYSFGVVADDTRNSLIGLRQESAGITSRLNSNPIRIDPRTNFTTGLQVSQLEGQNVERGLTITGNAMLSRQFSSKFSSVFIYNYTHDGFNDRIVGAHSVSVNSFLNTGRITLSLFGTKSLDIDRESLFADAGYSIGKLWRITSSYTLDRYLSTDFLDYNIGIGYRIGWREVGVIWSRRTQRFGLQLLGATIN